MEQWMALKFIASQKGGKIKRTIKIMVNIKLGISKG